MVRKRRRRGCCEKEMIKGGMMGVESEINTEREEDRVGKKIDPESEKRDRYSNRQIDRKTDSKRE